MKDEQIDTGTVFKALKGLNANTVLILLLFAGMYYLSQVFVTKEIYYRDQLKIDQTFKEVKDGQNRIIDILTDRNSKTSNP